MNETVVDIGAEAGEFAEDKDVARRLRKTVLEPALERGEVVVLDFHGSPTATQSFLHALFSHTIRAQGPEVLDRLIFRSASETVKSLVSIVVEYSQQGIDGSTTGSHHALPPTHPTAE